MDKPLCVIAGFQTTRQDVATKNCSKFDYYNLHNARLYLNSDQFPYDCMNLDFTSDKYAVLYQIFCNFQKSSYGRSGHQANSYTDFKTPSPLVVFDCLKANESVKKSTVDVRLEFEFT